MDDLLGALGQSIAHAGPEWALVALFAVIFAVKIWPALERRMDRADAREDAREARKAEESKQREAHEQEASRMQGQWLEQQDRSNAAIERSNDVTDGVRIQLERLADSVEDSKGHSRDMARKVDEIHRAVTGGEERK